VDRERWKRLSPLLDGLLDLESGARAAHLAALGREDAGLADELAALLAHATQADDARFLVGDVAEPVAAELASAPSLAGERVGAYVLEAPLGQGGTGVVWQARRADGRFEGAVAFKLLHLSLLGRAGALRFEREGAILARLAHPNIASLLDAGVTPAGQPYLVLELIEGERIDRHCDAKHLNVEQRVRLFRDVLGAVAHAHRHLVVHRDIKPSNILVTGDGRVKLLDFGIAKLLQGEGERGDATQITREGGRALTPEYAAPEQLRGGEVTTATDVYSLGVLLFQRLAGRHPTAPEHGTLAEVMQATLATDPGRLSARVQAETQARIAIERDTSLPALRRQLRGDLETIVDKALRKAPAERYSSVDALGEDLRRWLDGEPVMARAPTLAYRVGRFVTRHRGAVAAATLVFAAILAGLVGTISQAHRAEEEARQAQAERDNALRDLAFADGARELLSFLLSQGDSKAMTASELLAHAELLADRQFADDAQTRGRLQLMLGIEYGNVMEFEKAKTVLTKAQESARHAGNPSLLSNIDCLLAATLGDQNQPQRALALFGDAIARLQTGAGGDDSVLSACLHMRADLHAQLGQPEAMLADAQAALMHLGTPRPDQRVMANSIRVVVAEAYGRLGQTAKALAAYENSLADLSSMGRQPSARTAVRFNNFSRMLYTAGQPRRAEATAARGLAITAGEGAGNELDAILQGNRSRALVELGRLDEARALSERAMASAEARKDTRWAGLFALYGAPAWCGSGDLARCANLLDSARTRLKAALPAAHSSFGVIELEAAQLSLAQQQPAVAREQLSRALTIFEAATDKNPLRIRTLTLLTRSDLQGGDTTAAASHAALALAQGRAASKDLDSCEWLGDALVAQALVARARGDKAGADAALREAVRQLDAALGPEAPAAREAHALLDAA
jgi:serine/threonine protein kinase